jgi:hypothetical protein
MLDVYEARPIAQHRSYSRLQKQNAEMIPHAACCMKAADIDVDVAFNKQVVVMCLRSYKDANAQFATCREYGEFTSSVVHKTQL